MNLISRLPPLWPLCVAGGLVLLLGMRLDVMEVDSAQYASIAREMLHNGEWLEVYEHGQTYNSRGFPDKPPLLFWAGATGMWLFGENNWGFKLIPTLIGLFSIFAAGRWAAMLYGAEAKTPARIFYSFNAGFLLMHMDLRTDAMLVHFITIGCWQLEVFLRTERKSAFLGAFSALALGMLAKGPVALIAVLAAFGPEALLRRDWKRLFRWEWLAGILWLLLLLSPMLYGLYTQWGWENGIKYYFWTQSFGRITGENVWENNLPATYLLENFAWAFLPWVPAFMGMFFRPKQILIWRIEPGKLVPVFGFVLMLIAMSLSHYKLPHYVYVTWPFAAIWLSGWWITVNSKMIWQIVHTVLAVVMLGFTSAMLYWTLQWPAYLALLLPFTLGLLLQGFLKRQTQADHIKNLLPTVCAFLAFGLFANGFFYPAIMQYQSSSQAGKMVVNQYEKLPVYHWLNNEESIHALHFYSQQIVSPISPENLPKNKKFLLYTTPALATAWQKQLPLSVKQQVEMPYFKVTHLNPAFLNGKTRSTSVEKRVLLTIKID